MWKKVVMFCLMLMLVASSVSAAVTVRQFMNETDSTKKTMYAIGVNEGIVTGYLAASKGAKISQEKIDQCMTAIDNINSNFNNYVESTNFVIAYHLDNGGKTDDLLSIVISENYLNTEECVAIKGTSL